MKIAPTSHPEQNCSAPDDTKATLRCQCCKRFADVSWELPVISGEAKNLNICYKCAMEYLPWVLSVSAVSANQNDSFPGMGKKTINEFAKMFWITYASELERRQFTQKIEVDEDVPF